MTDQQLLRDYSQTRSEPAFSELVRRHVDLVYSAALRMVYDAHLAEDVTQGVFVAVAQNSRRLADHPVLPGWLHRTTQNLAANTVRSEVRHRNRELEAAAMNELCATESEPLWEHIAPDLDAALGELSEGDRDALLLRYFQRKSAREMAQTLGVSEEAAQKRVSRAVERLREFFAKRGVTVGASGLVLALSANAVQAAPVGLTVTISTAAALSGTPMATTAKGSALVKSAGAAGLAGTIIGPAIGLLGGLFGAYMSIKSTKSPRERQFMIRCTRLCAALAAVFVLVMFGITYFGRTLKANQRELFFGLVVICVLIYVAALLRLIVRTNRRQRQIQIEDGTYVETPAHQTTSIRIPGRAAIYGGLGGSIFGGTAWLVIAAIHAQDWLGAGLVSLAAVAILIVSASVCLRRPQQYWSVVTLVCIVLGVATLILVNVRGPVWLANNPEFKGWSARGLSGLVALVYGIATVILILRRRHMPPK